MGASLVDPARQTRSTRRLAIAAERRAAANWSLVLVSCPFAETMTSLRAIPACAARLSDATKITIRPRTVLRFSNVAKSEDTGTTLIPITGGLCGVFGGCAAKPISPISDIAAADKIAMEVFGMAPPPAPGHAHRPGTSRQVKSPW